ncbi:hypothetical protein NEOLEDRAFT_126198 [Neolentinus lepideus HHB14362 ss-1]|uniref:Uncharacterized protein n=1 Tax=Neolentinus lepideus HHB14362 ss-1 TaxID=1314782 RepID=A0A165MR57_9AGAM|nr:hypothetical protein NEOLEDRAFT_126198 [Neolentinus lepideus HHB14362 ss-1]
MICAITPLVNLPPSSLSFTIGSIERIFGRYLNLGALCFLAVLLILEEEMTICLLSTSRSKLVFSQNHLVSTLSSELPKSNGGSSTNPKMESLAISMDSTSWRQKLMCASSSIPLKDVVKTKLNGAKTKHTTKKICTGGCCVCC